jgi:hypothetical protein
MEHVNYRGALLSALLHATECLHNLLFVLAEIANKMYLYKC